MFGYMAGFDSDLFDHFERMRREMDAMFGASGGPLGIRSVAAGTYPAINVGASPRQVDVYVFAAGADPKSLDVSLQQNLLTVSGERKNELPEGAQALPDDVDPDKVNATYKDGVLHISVQRKEELQPRKIEVK